MTDLPCLALQSFPNKASLAMAVHKELGSGGGKKKMSRLKRIILRERADKAAMQAGTAAEQAAGNLVKSKHALECLQKQLKVWFFVHEHCLSRKQEQMCSGMCAEPGQEQACLSASRSSSRCACLSTSIA